MKTRRILFPVILGIALLLMSGSGGVKENQYIVLSWNDLGMHCANKDFSKLVVLPPYNNLKAHIIKKGDAVTMPEIVTSGFSVNYEIPGNTYSVGKTNFWSYEDQIFGVNLPDNIGLTGKGLSGEMEIHENSFAVDGIPITPFTDDNLVTEDPYQLALVQAFDGSDILIASTQNVIPVSNEINCVSSGCHSSENNILNMHSDDGGFDPTNTPILCASCHSSNALGTTGTPGLESLSKVIHEKHKDKTNNCYKCHPGANTQCHRDVMHTAGMVCQDCHGDMEEVAESISNGREPWLEEPRCGAIQCHGAQFSEEPGKLYRNSKGHGGLFCSACHGSPHAIVTSENERDNLQNVTLQGYVGTLNNCAVCHGYLPTGPGPHGIMAPQPIVQSIQLPQGWSSLSSYLIPLENNVEDILAPVMDDFIIMRTQDKVYWPDQSINTIGNWNPSEGYIIKMANPTIIPFTGLVEAEQQIILSSGWNLFPVLSSCNVPIEQLFAANIENIQVIKEVAGIGLFWPAIGVNTLQTLLPGKAYYVLTNNSFTITFPACD